MNKTEGENKMHARLLKFRFQRKFRKGFWQLMQWWIGVIVMLKGTPWNWNSRTFQKQPRHVHSQWIAELRDGAEDHTMYTGEKGEQGASPIPLITLHSRGIHKKRTLLCHKELVSLKEHIRKMRLWKRQTWTAWNTWVRACVCVCVSVCVWCTCVCVVHACVCGACNVIVVVYIYMGGRSYTSVLVYVSCVLLICDTNITAGLGRFLHPTSPPAHYI